MTGWGQDGPLADTAGHDITYLAITGLLHGIGPADGPPWPPANYVADFGGGAMFLVTGLLAALLHARTTGAGQVVDAAMTEGAAYLGSMTRTFFAMGGWKDERAANMLDGGAPNYRCYRRRRQVGRRRRARTAVLGGAGARRSASPTRRRRTTRRSGTPAPQCSTETFTTKTRDEWAEIFAPLDACVAPVLTLDRGAGPSAQRRAASYTHGRRRDRGRRGAEVLRHPRRRRAAHRDRRRHRGAAGRTGLRREGARHAAGIGHHRLMTFREMTQPDVPRSST